MVGAEWGQGKCGKHNGQQSQSNNQNSLAHADLLCWLVDYGIPRSEIERRFAKFLLNLHKQKNPRLSEQKFNLNHKNRES